jgi:S-DNA-T family DNA segregation ATPase FtsK/SpoIIIE
VPARPPAPARHQESLALEGGWRFPSLDLLKSAPPRATVGAPSEEALQANARLLESVLADYGVQGQIVEILPGPVVTLYELEPAPGIRSARVVGLADDVARSLSVAAVRIATVQGRNAIGIEVPNSKREVVYLGELLRSDAWQRQQSRLALALGKDISGRPVVADLARMPHLLIAGTTGSGKSVGINAMILSLLYRMSPEHCRLILIDPKMLELSGYDGIPHLMAPVVTEPAKAVVALKWTVREMERRYRSMSQLGVRNIGGYNERVAAAQARGEVVTRRVQTGFDPETGKPLFEEQPLALEKLPFIVVVIDEMADLMMVAGKEIEAAVQRLSQMARAAGIHVVMATQRPSVDVITGVIKANFPTRISFQVISKFDSRTILGEQGAEQLLGQGDMLYMAGGGRITRVHGPLVSDGEVEDVVASLREQGEPQYVEAVTEAPDDDADGLSAVGIAGASDGEKGLFDQAVAVVSREGKASTSFIQRHLQIGYNRAARLIEQMEKEGIVGPANHVGKREVLTRRMNEDE